MKISLSFRHSFVSRPGSLGILIVLESSIPDISRYSISGLCKTPAIPFTTTMACTTIQGRPPQTAAKGPIIMMFKGIHSAFPIRCHGTKASNSDSQEVRAQKYTNAMAQSCTFHLTQRHWKNQSPTFCFPFRQDGYNPLSKRQNHSPTSILKGGTGPVPTEEVQETTKEEDTSSGSPT